MNRSDKRKRFFLIAALVAVAIGVVLLIKWLRRNSSRISGGQRGITLMETLAAVAILAAVGVVFMRSMSTGYKSVGVVDEKIQAEFLIRSQLENIRNASYADNRSYPVTVTLPPQYSMNITATAPMHIGTTDNNTPLEVLMGGQITTIQEITVSVSHGGKPVMSVAEYKVK